MPASTPLTRRIVEKLAEKVVPWEMTLETTKYCNFDCRHCYVPRDALGVRREMTLEETKRLLADFRTLGGMIIHMTGGEVMVSRSFLDVLRHIRSLHMGVHISSNASKVDEATADEMARLDVSYVGVSLYGATPAVDERVTRRRGSHEACIKGIRILRSRGIPVRLKLPVLRSNVDDLADRVALARSLGLPFGIDSGITPKSNFDRSTEDERLSPEQMQLVTARIESEFRPYMRSDQVKPAAGFLPEPEPERTRAAFCNVGLTFCAVDSFGDVFPCIAFPAVAGNVRETPFAEIWRDSPLFHKLRTAKLEEVKGCNTCDANQTCGRCIGHAYLVDGDMMGPSSIDCARAGKEVPVTKPAPLPNYFGAGRC